ncbi:akirin-2 [Lingula anatina]|uniref:Akirin-2 n=1 Tax=Lingula anatina TaxID=7574 RepID=A0A1S3KGS5_LINAN|nr:akirin-2 [Lingula anatina]|eukprot:XP_013421659.1 akirin-2 [Lingula anatina]
MACATLKRSLDFDPLHSPRTPKRRRCIPMTMSPTTPNTKQQCSQSSFSDVAPKVTPEQIAANIQAEIKRLQHRRQLHMPPSPPPNTIHEQPADSTHQDQDASVQSSSTYFNALSPSKKEVPLFTFKQVSLICDRMLKEREAQIREEYDKVLTCKMAEQYEAFLKFNHDQIQRRFVEQPVSYVS